MMPNSIIQILDKAPVNLYGIIYRPLSGLISRDNVRYVFLRTDNVYEDDINSGVVWADTSLETALSMADKAAKEGLNDAQVVSFGDLDATQIKTETGIDYLIDTMGVTLNGIGPFSESQFTPSDRPRRNQVYIPLYNDRPRGHENEILHLPFIPAVNSPEQFEMRLPLAIFNDAYRYARSQTSLNGIPKSFEHKYRMIIDVQDVLNAGRIILSNDKNSSPAAYISSISPISKTSLK